VAELEELARDAGRADISGTAETVVARLDPATRIREGQDAELWVDVRMLHVFDPATGRNLSLAARDDADASTVTSGAAAPAASAPTPPSPEASAPAPPGPEPDGGQAPPSPASAQAEPGPASAGGEAATDGEAM